MYLNYNMLKKRTAIVIAYIVLVTIPYLTFGQASFDERLTSVSNISMTVNNLGLVGNSFRGSYNTLGWPSCEFPVNSGIEHLFGGGLWVGAIKDGQVLVTTGAIDASGGYQTGRAGFEYSADVGSAFQERSNLRDNPYFTLDAVSHQDFVANFTDRNIQVPGTSTEIQQHTPLNIDVHYEVYNWNFNFANSFVILNYTITNVGDQDLDSVYTGFWMDGVVRAVNITPPGGTPFFNKGGNGYIDSLQMAYEFDAGGDTAFTRSYIGLKFLGLQHNEQYYHPNINPSFTSNFNTWQFNSQDIRFFTPTNDNECYGKMALGYNHTDDWENVQETIKKANNRSHLLSVGPISKLAPGESITVAFAMVCAPMQEDGNSVQLDSKAQKRNLLQNAQWAQRAYNGEDDNANGILDPGEDRNRNGEIDRYILPTPPDIPKTRFEANNHQVSIYWNDNAESSLDPISKTYDFEGYRIYKSQFAFDLEANQNVNASFELIAEFDLDSNQYFYNTGFEGIELKEPVYFEGDTTPYHYKYTIDNLQNGWQHAVTLTAFDRGDQENDLASLESSTLSNLKRLFPGKPANGQLDSLQPFVYPNPFYAEAEWRGNSSFEEDRKIMFANLPNRCTVRIYNVAGDFIDEFTHNQDYDGSDSRWFNTFSDPDNTVFSGGEHAWDLLSKDSQILARGLYIFTVDDLDTGARTTGQFVIIK